MVIYETSALAVPAIPTVVGAALLLADPWIKRWPRPAEARAFTSRAVSLGLLFALLVLGAVVLERISAVDAAEPELLLGAPWIEVGATKILLEIGLDPAGMLIAAATLLWGLQVALRRAADDAPARPSACLALVCGGVVTACMARSGVLLAIGWQLAGIGAALGVARADARRFWRVAAADGALWIGLSSALMAAGSVGVSARAASRAAGRRVASGAVRAGARAARRGRRRWASSRRWAWGSRCCFEDAR